MPAKPSIFEQWCNRLVLELAPAHGRSLGALRTATAALIATILLLHLQLPVIAPGVYLIFLISYDVPYLTLRRTLHALAWQCVGFFAAIGLVIVTDNDPMARVLGIAGFTFLSAFLLQTCSDPQIGINVGVFSVLTLTNWEIHRPPSQLIYLSFAPVLTGAISMGCKVALEYLFTHRDPYRALQLEMVSRLNAIAALLRGMAADETGSALQPKLAAVTRFAFAGQGRMASLSSEIRSRRHARPSSDGLPLSLVPLLARLLDQAASAGHAEHHPLTPQRKEILEQLASRAEAIAQHDFRTAQQPVWMDEAENQQLTALAQSLSQLATLSLLRPEQTDANTTPSALRPPLFRADIFQNHEYIVFAGKLSLSATISYILYNALGWPGISTACLTVLIAGLNTSGASNQKLVWRLLGAVFGALLLGLGCQIFVYPCADTLLPFLISVFVVSFLAAWIARGAHFGYVGMQIAFSFYLVAFQESMMPRIHDGEFAPSALPVLPFGAPLAITQGRDRVVGVLLALVVMWLIFHQIHPRRTVERMRERLAHLLRHESGQIEQMANADPLAETLLRERALAIVAEIRALAEFIPYEFDRRVEADLEKAERIEQAVTHAGSLFLHLSAWLQSEENTGQLKEHSMAFSAKLQQLSSLLLQKTSSAAAIMPFRSASDATPVPEKALMSLLELEKSCQRIVSDQSSVQPAAS